MRCLSSGLRSVNFSVRKLSIRHQQIERKKAGPTSTE